MALQGNKEAHNQPQNCVYPYNNERDEKGNYVDKNKTDKVRALLGIYACLVLRLLDYEALQVVQADNNGKGDCKNKKTADIGH